MDETVVHYPQVTDTVVTSGNVEQKEDNSEDKFDDSKDFNLEDTIDNKV